MIRLIPLAFLLSILILFFLVEFACTPFAVGKRRKPDKKTTCIVLGVPIIFGSLTFSLIYMTESYGTFGWWSSLGLAMATMGVAIRVVGKKQLGDFFQMAVGIKRNHKLICDGIYQHIRHPLYLGIILFYVSIPFVYGLWWLTFSFVLPSVLSIFYRVWVEEKVLAQHFGKEWDQFAKSTWWFY